MPEESESINLANLAQLYCGDCLDLLPLLALSGKLFDSCVCDPPYGLKFMGKDWDHGVPGAHFWEAVLAACKPGAHLLAFGGTRTFHRLACAIEDAGWELRDTIMWVYSSGFPKSHNFGCRCRGGTLPYTHAEKSEQATKRGVRSVRNSHVSAPVDSGEGRGQVLQPGLPEQGSPELRAEGTEPETTGSEQPSMEGRSDLLAKTRELQADQIRPVSAAVSSYGEEGRVHHGTQTLDGAAVGAVVGEIGSRSPQESQSTGQPHQQFGVVRKQRRAQARGVEADKVCPKCGGLIDWSGFGTALKPAWEPIILARKPLDGTVAENVQKHGCGALNIDACRIAVPGKDRKTYDANMRGPERYADGRKNLGAYEGGWKADVDSVKNKGARWPANLIHDGSQQVLDLFPHSTSGAMRKPYAYTNSGFSLGAPAGQTRANHDSSEGSAARFFYSPKASRQDRDEGCEALLERESSSMSGRRNADNMGEFKTDNDVTSRFTTSRRNFHPCVKPTALMRYLCRLVTPPNGHILDPFMGSGSTGKAAILEGFKFTGIDLEPEYVQIATARIQHALNRHHQPLLEPCHK